MDLSKYEVMKTNTYFLDRSKSPPLVIFFDLNQGGI